MLSRVLYSHMLPFYTNMCELGVLFTNMCELNVLFTNMCELDVLFTFCLATVRKQDGRIDSISDTPPATPTITVPSPKSTYLPPNRSFAQIPQNRFDGVSDCYRSTESIETPVQTQFLSIRNVKKGHYRSRSVGSEYSIDNAPNNLHMVKEPSPIPSYLQPNGRRMVKQQSTESALPRIRTCLLYTSPSPRDRQKSRMPSSA